MTAANALYKLEYIDSRFKMAAIETKIQWFVLNLKKIKTTTSGK